MGDRGTKPSSSMISRFRRESCLCKFSSRLSSLPQRSALPRFHRRDAPARLPSRCTSPPWRCWTPGLPHGRGVRRSWLETALIPAGGWKSPLVVAQAVAGKPGLFLPGRKLYFCHSSQGCRGMTLYGYARVSVREPEDKNLTLQVERLVRAGCTLGDVRAEEADVPAAGAMEGGTAGQASGDVHSTDGEGVGNPQRHGKEIHRRRDSADAANSSNSSGTSI